MIFSQKDSCNNVVAAATILKVDATGKRHNSYFFTFKIEKVLEGSFSDSVIVSQEIYHDFGGVQILSKIYSDKEHFIQKNKDKPKEVIINFWANTQNRNNNSEALLIWATESYRVKSLLRLESLVKKYFKEEKTDFPSELMLQEYNGRLFFSINNILKVAVETRSGYWVIATVDKWE